MNESYLAKLRGLNYISSEEINNRIASGKYAAHTEYPIIINEDGTEIIDLRDGAIIPIRSRKLKCQGNRPTVRIMGVKGQHYVYTLVCEAWHKVKITDGYGVHHKDLNKQNNHYTNLEKLDNNVHKMLHDELKKIESIVK